MLDPLLLKNDLDSLKDNLKRRNLEVNLEQLIELDESRRKLRFEAEKLRADQKSLGKDIANAEPKEKDALLEKASQISENVKKLFDEVEEKDKVFYDLWLKIPNLISSTSPDGKTDEDNAEIKQVGDIKNIDNPKDHLEIAEKLGLIDVQKASEVSGSRFSYLFGDLVKIEFNLVSWALDILSSKGFTPCLLYTSPSPRDISGSRMPSSA